MTTIAGTNDRHTIGSLRSQATANRIRKAPDLESGATMAPPVAEGESEVHGYLSTFYSDIHWKDPIFLNEADALIHIHSHEHDVVLSKRQL